MSKLENEQISKLEKNSFILTLYVRYSYPLGRAKSYRKMSKVQTSNHRPKIRKISCLTSLPVRLALPPVPVLSLKKVDFLIC